MSDPTITSAVQSVETAVKTEEATLVSKVKAFLSKYYPIIVGVLIAVTRFI